MLSVNPRSVVSQCHGMGCQSRWVFQQPGPPHRIVSPFFVVDNTHDGATFWITPIVVDRASGGVSRVKVAATYGKLEKVCGVSRLDFLNAQLKNFLLLAHRQFL